MEEIVDALERCHADRQDAQARAKRGTTFIRRFDWATQTTALLSALED